MASNAVMKPIEDMQSLMGEMARQAGLASPLMAHPAAATAATTALSFAAASHMAGLMLGSWQGALEASKRMGMPVEAFDLTGGFRALDSDWNTAFGKAAAETVETTARRAGEATRDVAAEAATQGENLTASGRRAEAMTAETVASVADVVERAAGAATRAAEPVGKATLAEKPNSAVTGKPAAMAKPERPDDLKQIAGIGPKLEEVLNRLGIWSFAQIAAWGEAEIAWVDDYLQARGRIGRDGWLDQAKALTKK
jgi:NADH-quinone oxidoreductase subunit E